MNQSVIDQLLILLHDFTSGNNDKFEDANEKLCELIKTPIFNELCAIATNDEDIRDRYLSIIFIRRSLYVREFDIAQEEWEILKQFIIEYIFNETTERNCEYAISIGCLLCLKNLEESNSFQIELIEAAAQMANDKIYLALGFICQLIETKLLNDELFKAYNMDEICHGLVIQGLEYDGDNSSIMHKRAIELLHLIHLYNVSEEFLEYSTDLLQLLQTEAQFSIYSSTDDDESLRLFLFLYTIASENPDALSNEELDTFEFYLKFTYDTIRNQEVSPIKREYALLFFHGAFISQPSIFRNTLEDVIQTVFDILNCKYMEEPETFQPCFSNGFLMDLASEPDLVDADSKVSNVFSILMEIAQSNKESNDIERFRTSIACLKYITESAPESFESNSEEVCQLISDAFDIEDQFVFSEVCNFISMLSIFAFECIEPIFNDLTEILTKYYKELEALICLESILDRSNQPPMPYDKYIGEFVEILNGQDLPQNHVYIVIDCITNIIRKIESIDDDLYTQLRPVLIQIMENIQDARPDVYRCFSSCVRIAPQSTVEDIDPFANSMIEDLSNCQEHELVFSIAESVSDIVEIIPETFYSYASNFFDAFSQIFTNISDDTNQPINDTEEEDEGIVEEMNRCQSACGEILTCLSLLFTSYPSDLSSQFSFILQGIYDLLKSEKTNLVIGAANAIRIISPFLSEDEEFHPSSIIIPIVKKIEDNSNISEEDTILLQHLFNALAAISYDLGKGINDENESEENGLECLSQFFVDCLKMKVSSITDASLKNITNNLQGFVMNALGAFIFGGAFTISDQQAAIVKRLLKLLEYDRKRLFQSYVISALARICFVSPQSSSDLAPTLIETILTILSQKESKITENCKNSYVFSLILVLGTNAEAVDNELVNQINDIVFDNASFDQEGQPTVIQKNYSVLLLVLYGIFHIDIDESLISKILQILPDSDDEGIIVYANCIFEMFNGDEEKFQHFCDVTNIGKIATTVVLSPKWCISMIEQNVFNYFVEIVKQIPEDQLNIILEYNQAKAMKIKSILE